jgi:hypothetical protein
MEEATLNLHNALNSHPTIVLRPEAYYGLAGEIIRLIEPSSEAAPAGLLTQFHACFGNTIGMKPHFKAEDDIHSLKINVGVVGRTAKARKGLSWSRVRGVFERVAPDWENKHILFGLASGEGLINCVNNISGNNELGKRLLIVETEFASTLKVMNRTGNILSGIIRQGWDAARLANLSKNNPLYADDAHITLIGHVTEEDLLSYLNETEQANGFANRFIWSYVERSKYLPEGGKVDETTLAPLINKLKTAIEFASQTAEIKRDIEANKHWHDIYPSLSEGKPGIVGALTARAEAYVMRLACIYALLDCSKEISIEHLKAALAVWNYSEACVAYIFGNKTGNVTADTIMKALKTSSDGLSKTVISNLWSRHKSYTEIDRALELLEELNKAESKTIKTAGRNETRWYTIAK